MEHVNFLITEIFYRLQRKWQFKAFYRLLLRIWLKQEPRTVPARCNIELFPRDATSLEKHFTLLYAHMSLSIGVVGLFMISWFDLVPSMVTIVNISSRFHNNLCKSELKSSGFKPAAHFIVHSESNIHWLQILQSQITTFLTILSFLLQTDEALNPIINQFISNVLPDKNQHLEVVNNG